MAGPYLIAGGAWFGAASLVQSHLATTDGNLSVHLRKLEEAGYVSIEKSLRARKPVTAVSLTASGREAFSQYLGALSGLIGKG
jgi:DNA-binding MarR family transcriptional regulator